MMDQTPDITEMEKMIKQARAVNRAIVKNIHKAIDTAEKVFLDAGISPKLARKMAEKAVERELYDMQTKLGGW
jgi:hypothetical protein